MKPIAIEYVTIPIDTELKEAAEHLFAQFGLTLDEAIQLFLEESLQAHGFPFVIEEMV